LPEDAARAHADFLRAGGKTLDDLPAAPDGGWALVVDALFGIGSSSGLQRPIEGRYRDWIMAINALPAPRLAIDVPSGLDADTGRAPGTCVRATHTATFIALKPGLLTLDGPDYCGEISVHSLAIDATRHVPAVGCRVEPCLFAERLIPRPRNTHKGMNGDACVLGGDTGMSGAVLLAARAALWLGAGRVYACFLDPAAPGVDAAHPELMLRPSSRLPEHMNALAIGPGLGTGTEAETLLRAAIARDIPLLLDADALNIVSQHSDLADALRRRRAETVLTPHPAEAGRLLDKRADDIQADRVAAALELAQVHRAFIVLKGCGSIIATPDGRWFINTTGNAGMASAGMGDVLSGLVLALLAQGWSAESALLAAVHLHGAAADRLVSDGIGPIGLTAGETIPVARAVFNAWEKSEKLAQP
ncbi:MAG: NAD(P)H-hydrate dehydratase, partial [Azoarcus sp.]|nr:NAD(P)H-hydrate dehydratase [Azoarcus sp.]